MFSSAKEFEDEVRRIARLLWTTAEFGGSAIVDDRERDGIFVRHGVRSFVMISGEIGEFSDLPFWKNTSHE